MPGVVYSQIASPDGGYVPRVVRALDRSRMSAVAIVTVALSLGPFYGAEPLDYSLGDMVLEWIYHFAELVVLAGVLTLTYTLLDEALPSQLRMRLGALCLIMLAVSCLLTVMLYLYYGHELEHLPPLARLLADTLRYGLPAVFLVLVADAHRRALEADAAASTAELRQAHLGAHEAEQQLALLQAQVEPHFLFNVLGNLRRLYRTHPACAADVLASLMRYLRAALPQLRSRNGMLGDELDLARAYLELCRVRMGERLAFSIEAAPGLRHASFPPMLVTTLVENAIKHGIEPVGAGHVRIRAWAERDALLVEVRDDGAGFDAAASGGTGIGLANIQRQLRARYAGAARLTLAASTPRGATVTITIPVAELSRSGHSSASAA